MIYAYCHRWWLNSRSWGKIIIDGTTVPNQLIVEWKYALVIRMIYLWPSFGYSQNVTFSLIYKTDSFVLCSHFFSVERCKGNNNCGPNKRVWWISRLFSWFWKGLWLVALLIHIRPLLFVTSTALSLLEHYKPSTFCTISAGQCFTSENESECECEQEWERAPIAKFYSFVWCEKESRCFKRKMCTIAIAHIYYNLCVYKIFVFVPSTHRRVLCSWAK